MCQSATPFYGKFPEDFNFDSLVLCIIDKKILTDKEK